LASAIMVFEIFVGVTLGVYGVTSRMFRERNSQDLKTRVALVRSMVESTDRVAVTAVSRMLGVFQSFFSGSFDIDLSDTVKIGDQGVPSLKSGMTALNLNMTQVDHFTAITKGSVATIFVRKEDDFIRIATSLKKEDGARALCTALDRGHPGYQNLLKGEGYIGKTKLFGKNYMTAYDPIRGRDGETIGALFVGFDITEDMKKLSDAIKAIKIGENGYIFVINEAEGQNRGSAIIHPSMEAKNILDAKDTEGREFIKEMIESKEGITKYPWINKEAGETSPRMITTAFTQYPNWHWLIAAAGYDSEINREVTAMANVLGGAGILGSALLSTTNFLMIARILKPLKRLIAATDRMSEGDLTVELAYHSRDDQGYPAGSRWCGVFHGRSDEAGVGRG